MEGNKITGLGKSVRLPAGADVVDLGDVTLSPGFIDAHTHLTWDYSSNYNQNLVDRFRLLIPEPRLPRCRKCS